MLFWCLFAPSIYSIHYIMSTVLAKKVDESSRRAKGSRSSWNETGKGLVVKWPEISKLGFSARVCRAKQRSESLWYRA